MSAVKPPRALAGFSRLAPDDQAWWIEHCYMLPSYNNALYDPERSVLVIGEHGSGLSTSFDILRYHYPLINDDPTPPATPQPLLFAYPPQCWPGQPQALFSADQDSHFKQFMAHLAEQIASIFKYRPALLGRLSLIGHEFMAWMARHYLGPRRGELWCRFVEQHDSGLAVADVLARARRGDLDSLYQDDLPNDMRGQIEECLDIVRALGWNGIFAVAELGHAAWLATPPAQQEALRQSLLRLLESLTLLQNREFGFKVGIVADLLSLKDAEQIPRSRTEVIAHSWTNAELEVLARRLWTADHGAPGPPLTPADWRALEPDITSIWGKPCPAASVGVIGACAALRATSPAPPALDDVRAELYRQHAPLRYYPQISGSQVWRGAERITLEEAQIVVFQALWRHCRTKSYASKEELLGLAGSATNLDKIISRIRKHLEPIPGAEIYLHRTQTLGTRLEHCLP
jgi:hypothetical protein